MQSLCLNVEVLSSDGTQIDLRESDTEVFRAAEELGIDLSGVRAEGNGAADEQEEQVVAEGEGGTDGAQAEAKAQVKE